MRPVESNTAARWAARWAAVAPLVVAGLAAHAADTTFSSEAGFVAAAGATLIESFESLAGTARGLAPIAAPLLTVTTTSTPIGVQTGPDAPNSGFGAAATDGTHYVSVYLPNVSQGTIRIDLASPGKVFGFNIMDIGEVAGTLVLRTDVGAFAAGVTLATYAGGSPSGTVFFYGLTQNTAFSSVFITVNGLDEAYGLDKVYVGAVPEPHAALLMGAGALALVLTRRARRRH
jgi:hypothetical protein